MRIIPAILTVVLTTLSLSAGAVSNPGGILTLCDSLTNLSVFETGNIAQIARLEEWNSVIDATFLDSDGLGILFSTGVVEVIDFATCSVHSTSLDGDVVEANGRISFSPDGSRILYTFESGQAAAWDAQTGAALFVTNERQSAFDFDLRVAAVADEDTFAVLDVDTHQRLAQIRVTHPAEQPAFFDDAHKVAWIDQANAVHIWDYVEGLLLSRAMDGVDNLTDLEIHPADDLIAVAGYNMTRDNQGYVTSVTLLNASDLSLVDEINIEGQYYGVRYNVTGDVLILTGFDSSLRESEYFWSLATGQELLRLNRGPGGGYSALNITSQFLANGSGTSYGVPVLSFPDLAQIAYLDTPGGTKKQEFNQETTMLLTLTFNPTERTTIADLWGIVSDEM